MGAYKRTLRYDTPTERPLETAQDGCASKRHPFTQRSVRQLCKVLLRIVNGSEAVGSLPHSYYAAVSMTTVQSATPYRQRKRSREIFVALVCDVTSRVRNESTVLHMIRVAPWRRGAPKAQDGCASKRHPSTQRSVCQLCQALLRIVIGSEAVGSLPHSYASKCVGREMKTRYYI